MSSRATERSKVEQIKEASAYLKGDLSDQLASPSSHLSEDGRQVLKFHGIYQQDDRDVRRERKRAGEQPRYLFMVRTKIPGGVLSAEQYLVHDHLADRFGNGTLRVTTRQDFQFHGVLKGNLQAGLKELNQVLVTTLAACGDVERNVVACPAPLADPLHGLVTRQARALSSRLLPRSRAYYEVWLNGERIAVERPAGDARPGADRLAPAEAHAGWDRDGRPGPGVALEDPVEPLYGPTYLPRKFKTGIALAGDNCIDVFTQDLGLVAIPDGREVAGFNVLAGGGLGMSHGTPGTFPRLADVVGFVPPHWVFPVAEAVISIHRDFGNRADRHRARLKYVLAERGLPWFREELERRLGFSLSEPTPMEPFRADDHLGWHPQGDGRLFLGLPVENGRIRDAGQERLKTGLRELVQRLRPGVRLTPQQNVLLTDLEPTARPEVEVLLRAYGIRTVEDYSAARRHAMACPALPTCGLAITEAERAMPGLMGRIEAELRELGLEGEPIAIRMTGCPNGCARPYTAELAFVGRGAGRYTVFVGGDQAGTRLALPFLDLVALDDLPRVVRPLFERWKRSRRPGETFGDFCHRVGLEHLRR
ncbi:NADPH-dependent assimilatory sulfite reductase hemoprotein subunit [Limnochorda pilosa]|uniref:Sulfite reductase n=1 Tax=Limnochorda pilosa TaxID=1555112 RepID=A0A0K2SQ06_LIMPI|nr:NADPH-dependent assimilatory sulfite reductase hemoprotein subunit [Limnochorda pilosa]BAS29171.1 sulfite reductase [Limnochorda pilosa]